MEIVLYGVVRPLDSASSRRTRIRAACVQQAVASRTAERRIKGCRIEDRQLVVRLVGPRQIGVAKAQVQRQPAIDLPVVVDIELEVGPAALLLEDVVLFSPVDAHILEKIVSRAVASVGERNARASRIADVLAAIVSGWTEGNALDLGEI